MKFLEKIENFLNWIFMLIGGLAVLALMILATGNVVLRIFHAPFRGTYEIVGFLGAVVIGCALGYTQKRKDHIVVDILTEKFPKKVNRLLDAVNYLITTIFFAIVSWQTYVYGMRIWSSGELSETLKLPFHPFVLTVAFSFALLTLVLIMDFFRTIMDRKE